MTDLAVPNLSHIFSPTLVLRQLALYRLGLRMMVFADDVVLLGRQHSASLDAPVRTEVDAAPFCNLPSYDKLTWVSYDFCGNAHAIMAGAKALDSSYAARGVRQSHVWNSVTWTCTPLVHGPGASAARQSPSAVQSVVSQTSPLPMRTCLPALSFVPEAVFPVVSDALGKETTRIQPEVALGSPQ
jgi:hypothetical protein